jgi:hypothetical protein
LQRSGDGSSAIFFEVPTAVMTALGPDKRVPVCVVVNGHEWRTTTLIYGGKAYIGLNAAARSGTRGKAGDRISATVRRDDMPRIVRLPKDLAAALRGARMRALFDGLSFSHRREYVSFIEEAKRPETRAARITKTVEAIHAKGAIARSTHSERARPLK